MLDTFLSLQNQEEKTAMKIIRLILINTIILFILLIIIDPFFTVDNNLKSYRSVIIREPKPEYDLTFDYEIEHYGDTSRNRKTSVAIHTNEEGFYLGEHTHTDIDNTEFIFFGGSTTECMIVDENKRFPYLLSQILIQTESSRPIKTLNAGYSGSNTIHSLTNLTAKGLEIRPKMAFLMHNINDLVVLLKAGSYWKGTGEMAQLKGSPNDKYGERLESFLSSSKDLFFPNTSILIKRTLRNFKKSIKKSNKSKIPQQKSSRTYDWENVSKEFELALKAFVRLARNYGIEVVLMTQFSRFDPEDTSVREAFLGSYPSLANPELTFDEFCRLYHAFNEIIRKVSREESVFLIDLALEVSSAKDHIYDYVHLTDGGSETVAEIIAEKITSNYPEYQLIE